MALALGEAGVLLLDTDAPAFAQPVASYDTGCFAYGLQVQGQYLYVHDYNGLVVLHRCDTL